MKHILLPWTYDTAGNFGAFVRRSNSDGNAYGLVGFDSTFGWRAKAWSIDGDSLYDVANCYHTTKEKAINDADALLVKAGWLLLNEGDGLLTLL